MQQKKYKYSSSIEKPIGNIYTQNRGEKGNYVKNEIFVLRHESQAASVMHGPYQNQYAYCDSDDSDHREDREPYHRHRHWEILEREKGESFA